MTVESRSEERSKPNPHGLSEQAQIRLIGWVGASTDDTAIGLEGEMEETSRGFGQLRVARGCWAAFSPMPL